MIPRKLFDRLTTSLIEQRRNPCDANDAVLLADEEECNWPWAANQEQLDEWRAIHDRTRAEFEQKVVTLKRALA